MNKLLPKRQQEIFSHLDQITPMFVTDTSGTLEIGNEKFCSMLGCDSSAAKGNNVRTYLAEPYAQEPIGPVTKREVQFLSKSGFPFWLEVNIFSIVLESGADGFLWLGFDVTERKSTEQYLAESQLFSKTLMQTAPVGIFLTNPTGGCTYVNGFWAKQAGMNGAKAKGNGWQLLLHPDDKDDVVREWTALLLHQKPFVNKQYRYLRPDGRATWVLCSAVSLHDTNLAIAGYLRIEQDITDRLQSERIIREQQETMVSTSKMSALGEMAGGVAHEINNPLAIIKNLSGQLQEVLNDDPLDKSLVKDMAAQVEKTTDRIAKIVQGLRSFSRDGSKDPFYEVSVQQLIEETLSFCNERFKNNGIQITVDDFDKNLRFEGRATEVSQVLLNLLNNAHDAIAGRKEKWIKVSIVDQPEWINIQVTDCGDGITPEIRERIFQPFFTTKEIGKGTGMGLSISVGIIKQHKGELKLDTRCPNTRFVIRLPKKQTVVSAA